MTRSIQQNEVREPIHYSKNTVKTTSQGPREAAREESKRQIKREIACKNIKK